MYLSRFPFLCNWGFARSIKTIKEKDPSYETEIPGIFQEVKTDYQNPKLLDQKNKRPFTHSGSRTAWCFL